MIKQTDKELIGDIEKSISISHSYDLIQLKKSAFPFVNSAFWGKEVNKQAKELIQAIDKALNEKE